MLKQNAMFCGASLCTLMLAMSGGAQAGDTLAYGPAEAWVKPLDLPKPDPALANAPVQVLLQNLQTRFAADGDTTYTEIALKVQNAQGLSAAQPYVLWSPDTSQVTVNKVVLIRNGQVIDLLKAGQTFTTVRREANLERAVIDGMLTGILQPEGLQVGDVLDYAITLKRHDPVMGGNSENLSSIITPLKMGLFSLRTIWDKDKAIRYRQVGDLGAGKITTAADGSSEFRLDLDNVPAPAIAAYAPARYSAPPTVEFSQFESWRDISRLMAPVYAKAATLAPESPLRAEADKIRSASSDPKVQAAAALHLVQNDVRYLYLDMNQGGYVPAEADITWSRRFGDCKGKTVLLLALLRELNIAAVPATVSVGRGEGLNQHLPMIELFDHVMVKATIGGRDYWLDGTRSGDRDLDSLRVPNFYWALPLTSDGADLEALKTAPLAKPEADTLLRIDASRGFDSPARVHAEHTWRGDMAVTFDTTLKASTDADRDKALRGYWGAVYGWVTVNKVSAQFDPLSGEEKLVMDGEGRIDLTSDDKAKGWQYTATVDSIGWDTGVDRKTGIHRDAPVAIEFPLFNRSREEIVLPKDGKGFTVDVDPIDKTLAGTELHRSAAIIDGVFVAETSKRSLVAEIPYDEASRAAKTMTRIYEGDIRLVTPETYRFKGKIASTARGKAGSKSADQLILEGAQRAGKGEVDEALSTFNDVLKADPANAKALGARGALFVFNKNKPDAGIIDLEQAVKIDPSLWTNWNVLAVAYAMKGRSEDAIDAFSKAIEIYPNNTWALNGRASAYLAEGKPDKAKVDAEAVLALDPSNTDALGVLATAALRDKKTDEALALVDNALKADPDNTNLLYEKAQVLQACGDSSEACKSSHTQAIAIYDRIIALDPSEWEYVARAGLRRDTDHDGALADLDTALKLNPKSTSALLLRAYIFRKDKAFDKARDDLDQAVAGDPKNPSPHIARADLFFDMGKSDLAVSEIDAAVDLDTDKANGLNNACWSRAIHNVELEKALDFCNQAVELEPKRSAYLDSRGFVKLRVGQLDGALTDYDSALALTPRLAPSLYGRGLIKLRKGQKAEGEADLAAARDVYAGVDKQFEEYDLKP